MRKASRSTIESSSCVVSFMHGSQLCVDLAIAGLQERCMNESEDCN